MTLMNLSIIRGRKGLLLFLLILYSTFGILARSYSPDELQMPNLMAGEFIADPENLLSAGTKSEVNRTLKDVHDRTTAEVGVAIVPDLGDMEVEDFANKLYDYWKVGKKDNNNGVLLIISPESRQARIQTGYGTEGVLPDAVASYIMRHEIVPAMREGDLDGAVTGATSEIAKILTDPEYAEELRSSQSGYGSQELLTPEEKAALKTTVSWLATILFLAGGIALLCVWISGKKKKRREKVTSYRNLLWILVALGVMSFGAGLIWAVISWLLLKKARNTSDPCPNCGNPKMKHLSGMEAIQHLTPAQQTEKRLRSREHEVWRCQRCGQTTVDTYDNPFSKYTVCDRCGTKAMHSIGSRTVRQPNTFQNGIGEHVSRCEHCGNEYHQRYTIPSRASTAAAGAVILGAGRRRGGFGGGGGGFGGFGGGMSGGGGASGRW